MGKVLSLKEKELARLYAKEYYNKNKATILAKSKLYRETYPEKIKAEKKKSNSVNKAKIKVRKTQWYKNNVEYAKEYAKEYRKANLAKCKISAKKYRKNNATKIRKHNKEIRDTNVIVKLIDNTRRTIRYGFESKGFKKNNKTESILGCSFSELKQHLESQFVDWMTWDNYGNPKDGILEINKTWDIDHIIPISLAKTKEDVIRLNHYTNLQPLCSYTNRYIKRNYI